MDESLIKINLQDRFKNIKDKKILVYGTGAVALRLIKALTNFNIVGVIDRIIVEGEFDGIPVLVWEDIDANDVDIIIIAAAKRNYKVIFDRIKYYCFTLGILIYGENGQNLTYKYGMKYIDHNQAEYFKKSAKELKELINQYDAVSFDLFDTLIMRKVLKATDIFDLVEKRIRKKGIYIDDFKKKRQTAALQSKYGNIDKIYENLRIRTGITEEESILIKQEEIQCEKEYLIPRNTIVEMMNYAIMQGKIVNIISDMHLPAHCIESLLHDMGITGYRKLYVSCEYEMGKADGLFQIYLRETGNAKCLHIGDNLCADVVVPRQYGIDSYEIKSAYEMLNMSSLRKILVCSGMAGCNEALGLIVSEIFNDPFALYNTMGFVKIKRIDIFAKLFIGPVVLVYMQNLLKVLQSKKYEAILFSARDGFLFKKIYDALFLNEYNIPSVYFLTSRKLCLTATLDSKDSMISLCSLLSTKQKSQTFLKEILECEKISEKKEDINIQEYIFSFSDQLKVKSTVIKENYKKYFLNTHIFPGRKYLFCDLNSRGTIQEILVKVFALDLEGFYLCKKLSLKNRNINVNSVYDEQFGNDLTDVVDLIETLLTSEDPSVCSMNENGEPVYAIEKRTEEEMEMIRKAHIAIMEYMYQCRTLNIDKVDLDPRFPETMLELFDAVNYTGELEFLKILKHIDDLSQTTTYILGE